MFEVAEGGFLDIDVRIEGKFSICTVFLISMINIISCFYYTFLTLQTKLTGPDGKIVHSGERESNGKYTFAAHMDGKYKYCFSNQMSTMTPKVS